MIPGRGPHDGDRRAVDSRLYRRGQFVGEGGHRSWEAFITTLWKCVV